MTKTRSTKSALISSVIALFLCFAMLLGTTFAWFTDSVTSANNIIQSGNLDIVLEYYDAETKKWKDVDGSAEILKKEALWEPGYTDVVYLRFENAGSLDLKYQLGVNIISEKEGTNVDGKKFKLSDYIYFGVAENVDGENGAYENREDAQNAVKSVETILSKGYAKTGKLEADSGFQYLAMVVYMPTTVGNVANHNGADIPQIDLGINILATQVDSESDSFNNTYDAYAAVDSIEKAVEMMNANKDVYLIGVNEPNTALTIPAAYTGTLALGNVRLKTIQAEANANIVIVGNVTIDAYGDGTAMVAEATGTSAITANGALKITGDGGVLTAIANGDHAYGIGGDATAEITLENLHISNVKGGHVQPNFINDTKYGKTEPEGGAAIGSGSNGAVITLNNVTIDNAQGGSKAAGIGARYWTGVTINITDSNIKNVEGGNASAGIGGSRVSDGATESGTTINITNSTITAKGGEYGAGIGSGYDTHCQAVQPMCTINITDSTINAEGGQYAAGIGTGYHNAALNGEIKNSTVNAVSGKKFYKDTYTQAQDIGFGVVDPAREGNQTDSNIIYNGVTITIPEISDKWDGTADTSWYNENDTEFTLTSAEQIAGLADLVDGGNTFAGKTIKLSSDLDLYTEDENGEPISFEPVGSFSDNEAFKGTFDGQGHTISNLYQNGWALENGYWDGPEYGMGFFSLVENASIKNINFDGASLPSEANIMGVVAGGAANCVFENINVTDAYLGNHSWYSGGLIGWAEGDIKLINCDIDASSVVSSQWGDFNNANGGLIGGIDSTSTIYLKDCDVACVIDAYNDVTSAYHWYSYRSCGMLIGDSGQLDDPNGDNVGNAIAPNLICENVTVTYGDWANYHYCEFGSAGYPFCRVEAGESTGAYGNARVGEYFDANGNKVVDDNHVHNDGEKHNELIVFDQLYGGESGDRYCTYGTATHDGVTVIYNNK